MDVLSDLLRLLRLRANVFFHASVCGAWSVDSSGEHKATFHLIARGACWLHLPGRDPQPLRSGDLLVFPRDAVHVISSSPVQVNLSPHSGLVSTGGEGPATSLVCGYFEFETPLVNPILAALPDVVHIRSEDSARIGWLDQLIRYIAAESESGEAGADVVVDRLADVLFIQVVRSYMREHAGAAGVLSALSDRKIARALQRLHDAPGSAWTVDKLADTAAMSRAAFAKRFQELMGMAPMTYVTHWRMQCAFEQLRVSEQSVAAIAEQCGYQSEAAFRKAFKQHMGYGPGAVRRRGGG
ncbi:MAG: AraC family transcriptional regulator [Gammaproteobacteria bacterium]|nr:AraC family transcriptional regulator [Gammaproteobacteria bacterium]